MRWKGEDSKLLSGGGVVERPDRSRRAQYFPINQVSWATTEVFFPPEKVLKASKRFIDCSQVMTGVRADGT